MVSHSVDYRLTLLATVQRRSTMAAQDCPLSSNNCQFIPHLETLYRSPMRHRSDYSMKAASHMPETILDPATRCSNKTAFNRAYRTDLGSFDWLNLPENAYIHRRFNMAMEGTAKMSVPWEVFEGMLLGQ